MGDHPMTIGHDMDKKPEVAPGGGISTSSHIHITPSPPLMCFIFIPSRDLTSLRGASIDTFRYFPLVNSEKPLNGPHPRLKDIFPNRCFQG